MKTTTKLVKERRNECEMNDEKGENGNENREKWKNYKQN